MSYTVLFVDDDHNVLEGLTRALRKEPYEILTAPSAEEAALILEKSAVDVIVCDEQMPGISGTEFLTQTAKDYPEVIRIILTGHSTPKLWSRAINECDIFRFLIKPCDELELATMIRKALKERTLANQ